MVHTLRPAGSIYSDNHRFIYLLLSDNQGSMNDHFNWIKQAYLLSSSAIRHWDFLTSQDVQVCQIVNHIYLLGRQRYKISGDESDYRY